ncbi:transposase [uncultured Nostoc sp.]|uniref:IS701 family transposase n=1 Tax=uncultured Nostoc sp. TaxID=340711 RepID=UPI0035CB820E
MKTTTPLYCQYLLSSQINYTCTNLADHFATLSHDDVSRFLKEEKLTPRRLWEKVNPLLTSRPEGYMIFDDVVLEKIHSCKIQGGRRQYSGNQHGVIKGIGVVNCVYYDPVADQFWVIDYRIFDPERDGKTQLDHVQDRLISAIHRDILFGYVLMDSWYATAELMKRLISKHKIFYCPLKANRKVDDSQAQRPYRAVSLLDWSEREQAEGKLIKIDKFPLDVKVKLFRVVVTTDRTDWLVTNDLSQHSVETAQQESSLRWKIEQLHREEKQLTGLAKCQCRLNRSQRNHIAAASLVWIRLRELANVCQTTVYQLKHSLLSDYLRAQLMRPTIQFA